MSILKRGRAGARAPLHASHAADSKVGVRPDAKPASTLAGRTLGYGAVTGAVMGLIVAAAYVAGTADARSQHAKITSLAKAAQADAGALAVSRQTASMDRAALALARRFDSSAVGLDEQRERQSDQLEARLQKVSGGARGEGLVLRASLGGPFNPAAEPYRYTGALNASRDLECLTQAVYYEARGETAAGQAAVAQVVLNRARHPAFPKTVCGVVFQGAGSGVCQFSFACDGSMRRVRDQAAWKRAERVAARALGGYVMPEVGNATHFHTTQVAPGWGPRMIRVGQVGMHIFYRFGGRNGGPGAFGGAPRPSGPAEGLQLTAAPTQGPVPYEVITGSGAKVTLAVATTETDAPGVGGPAGKPQEPASAPPSLPDGEGSGI